MPDRHDDVTPVGSPPERPRGPGPDMLRSDDSMTVAVAAAAATALVAVCGMVWWMILSPRRATARGQL